MYFDIGSNIGRWALANIDTCDRIVAIEASPQTFSRLQHNCRNDKIILLNYAVCDNNGEDVKFYHCPHDTLSTLNKDWLTSDESRFCNYGYIEINCKTITIDKLIETYGKPSLIKIDVEGGEYECMRSLTQKVDMLCFEWASEVNSITFQCLDHLKRLGFSSFYIQSEDDYTFRPSDDIFYDIDTTKSKLSDMRPKIDWGMIWCK
jgi:FkbM family methyltransferase